MDAPHQLSFAFCVLRHFTNWSWRTKQEQQGNAPQGMGILGRRRARQADGRGRIGNLVQVSPAPLFRDGQSPRAVRVLLSLHEPSDRESGGSLNALNSCNGIAQCAFDDRAAFLK